MNKAYDVLDEYGNKIGKIVPDWEGDCITSLVLIIVFGGIFIIGSIIYLYFSYLFNGFRALFEGDLGGAVSCWFIVGLITLVIGGAAVFVAGQLGISFADAWDFGIGFLQFIFVGFRGGDIGDTPTPTDALPAVTYAVTYYPTPTLTQVTLAPTATTGVVSTLRPASTAPPGLDIATVTTWVANLRAGPGANYKIVGSTEKGKPHQVYGRNSESTWLLLSNTEQIWINARLVELKGNIEDLPVYDPPK